MSEMTLVLGAALVELTACTSRSGATILFKVAELQEFADNKHKSR